MRMFVGTATRPWIIASCIPLTILTHVHKDVAFLPTRPLLDAATYFAAPGGYDR